MYASWILLTVFIGMVKADTFNCMSCSYTMSSDPTYDYECASQPYNFTKLLQVPCTTPHMCVTRASFSQDKKKVRSVTRACLPQQEICQGNSCCNNDGVYPTCEAKCRSEQCNNGTVEIWLDTSTGTTDDGTNGIGRLYDRYSVCALILTLMVHIYT